MFWDRISGIYDLFGNVYNGRVNRKLCRLVSENEDALGILPPGSNPSGEYPVKYLKIEGADSSLQSVLAGKYEKSTKEVQ